jgi:hypothetical protein
VRHFLQRDYVFWRVNRASRHTVSQVAAAFPPDGAVADLGRPMTANYGG